MFMVCAFSSSRYFAWHTISAYISSGILSEKLTAISMTRLACRPGRFLRMEFGLPESQHFPSKSDDAHAP